MTTEPGWHPDPWAQGGLRWWDGSNWTSHSHGASADLGPPPQPPAQRRANGPLLLPLLIIAAALAVLLVFLATGTIGPDRRNRAQAAPPTTVEGLFNVPADASRRAPVPSSPSQVTSTTTKCEPPKAPPNAPKNAATAGPTGPPTTVQFDPSEPSPAGSSTSITLVGCGSYILGSGRYRYDLSNARITVRYNYGNAIVVNIEGDERWDISFGPPQGQQLARGVYANVQRFPFNNPVAGGFDVSGEGRGCNEERSTFTIYEIKVVNNLVTRLLAYFEQHCEQPDAPGSYGVVDFTA